MSDTIKAVTTPTNRKLPDQQKTRCILEIQQRYLQAINLFTSRDETRFIIQSIFIEVEPTEGLVNLVATNGRCLAVLRLDGCVRQLAENFDAHFIVNVAPVVKVDCTGPVRINIKETNTVFEFNRSIGEYPDTITTHIPEGTYPNYRQVIPATPFTPSKMYSFAGEYLKLFADAFKKASQGLCTGIVIKSHEGSSGPELEAHSVFPDIGFASCPMYGVLMPVRNDEALFQVPSDWMGTGAEAEPHASPAPESPSVEEPPTAAA